MPRPQIDRNRLRQIAADPPRKSPPLRLADEWEETQHERKPAPKRWKPQHRDPGWPPNLYRYERGRYFFEREHAGRRIREALGKTLKVAMKRALEINEAVDRGDYSPVVGVSRSPSVGDYLAQALNALGDRSKETQASYANRIRQFTAFLNDCHPSLVKLIDVTPEIGREYVAWRQRRDVTRCGWRKPTTPTSKPHPSTVRDDIARLRALFRTAVRNKWLTVNPFDDVRIPKSPLDTQTTHRPLTQKQVRLLIQAARKYDKMAKGGSPSTFKGMMEDITTFYLLTGLRKLELIFLPWQHVELEWGDYGLIHIKPYRISLTLHVQLDAHRAVALDRIAKDREAKASLFANHAQAITILPSNHAQQHRESLLRLTRADWDSANRILKVPAEIKWQQKATVGSIPLTKAGHAILTRRKRLNLAHSPFVFPHPDRGPLRSDYWAEFKGLLRTASLPAHFRVHDLRHTFGFTLRERGVPLETIMGLMRHANIEETMIYAQYSDRQGAKGITALDGFI